MTKIIHIEWEGPFLFNGIKRLDDVKSDYGIFQIYGDHPIYGSGVLLYIGKAQEVTFYKILYPDRKYWREHHKRYVGRLAGHEIQAMMNGEGKLIYPKSY